MGYKKNDPCIEKAYDDERLFVLMARDFQAPEVIIKWIAHSLGNQPDDKIREALECAIEMQNTGQKFRDRKESDDKKIADRKERDQFEAWKKNKEAGNRHLKALFPDVNFKDDHTIVNEHGPEILNMSVDIKFAQRFCEWLNINPKLVERDRDFKVLFKLFLDGLPSAR